MAQTRPKIVQKTCPKCDTYLTGAAFYKTRSKFFTDGYLPICKSCLLEMVDVHTWTEVDKFCQWANYPFIPDIWTKLYVELKEKALDAYVLGYCATTEYKAIDWRIVQDEWKELISSGKYKERLPELDAARRHDLMATWGEGYKDDEYEYMEKFYSGLCKSHNIITPTQQDNARNLAKLSVRISKKISKNEDVDKDIKSYTELMKTGGFTTENVKNMSDFESVGELVSYLEKTGWKNPYYDDAPKDVVDFTIANMQSYIRRIVMGETHLKDAVEQRMAALGLAEAANFELSEEDFMKYDDGAFNEIEVNVNDADENEEFEADET